MVDIYGFGFNFDFLMTEHLKWKVLGFFSRFAKVDKVALQDECRCIVLPI